MSDEDDSVRQRTDRRARATEAVDRELRRRASRDRALADAVRLARSIAGTAMAALTLVDETHLWILTAAGVGVDRVARAGTFCDHAITSRERFVVEDASANPLFAGRDFVTSAPNIRYYAGLPLTTRDHRIVGTLCVADQRPHMSLTEECFRHLALILEITADRIEQHRLAVERERMLEEAREIAKALGSEAASLAIEADRLVSSARAHELATDAAMQGVRQIVHLDREIHDVLSRVPRRGVALVASDPPPDAIRAQLRLHNAISLAVEDDIDALVGSAATVRMRSGTLQAQGQRLVELSSVLDDSLVEGRPSPTGS